MDFEEDQPNCGPMKNKHNCYERHRHAKLSRQLAWLDGFLEKNIGSAWNDVFSGIVQHLNNAHLSPYHKNYMREYAVDFKVEKQGGVDKIGRPVDSKGHLLGNGYKAYYIDLNGILRKLPKKTRKHKRTPQQTVLFVNDNEGYVYYENVWYSVVFGKINPERYHYVGHYDVLLKRSLQQYDGFNNYGKGVYVLEKKQCGKKEIKLIHSIQQRKKSA